MLKIFNHWNDPLKFQLTTKPSEETSEEAATSEDDKLPLSEDATKKKKKKKKVRKNPESYDWTENQSRAEETAPVFSWIGMTPDIWLG